MRYLPSADDGVSVVIPHYGEPGTTTELIENIRSWRTESNVQVIVSDDASRIPFPKLAGVEVVRSEANRGFGAAVNRGARLASHPWLLIMNSDVSTSPEFLEQLLQQASPFQPALCGVAQFVPRLGSRPPAAMRYQTPLSTALQHSAALSPLVHSRVGRRWARTARREDQTTGIVQWVGGAVMLLPREAFVRVGGFDERYFMYMEEVDLQRRLQAQGVRSVFLSDVSVVHESGLSSGHVHKEMQHWRSRMLYERIWNGPFGQASLNGLMTTVIVLDGAVSTVKRGFGRPGDPPGHWKSRLRVLREARAHADSTSQYGHRSWGLDEAQ